DYDDFDEDIDEGGYTPPPQRRAQPRRSEPQRPSKKPKKGSTYKKSDREEIKKNFGSHKQSKKKKMNPIKKFFIILLVIILIVFILLQLLIWKYIGDVKKVETQQRSYTSGSMESEDVLNILLVGSDTRSLDERGRTDSIILLSIDKKNKKTIMTSFMRDTYVTFPGLDRDGDGIDDMGKINAANVYGGPELLLDTIEYNFDISVDRYFYVDFFSFTKIVDAVGGIELDISDEEAAGMEDPMGEQNNIFGNKKGTDYLDHGGKKMHVNGNQALAYARLRYVGNADFERTQRQRTVISKIVEKAKTLNPIELNSFIETTLESLTTNYTDNELYFLSYRLPFIAKYKIESQRIPEDDTFTYGDHDVGSTLDIDFDKAKDKLRTSIYS
ncbi:MAG: LCP family protein, partial [Ruminococcus sp.]|nr:LCP family protein [Ruminococcus sp.]